MFFFNKFDLSNFNIQNVANIRSMFSLCSSLRNINLDNFEILNVDNMYYGCSSLIKIDLSNFRTQFVKDVNIFSGCLSLIKDNVKTHDKRIIEELNKLPKQESN